MEQSRANRKLGISSTRHDAPNKLLEANTEDNIEAQEISKAHLKSVFQAEIEAIVSFEIQEKKAALTKEFQEKVNKKLAALEVDYKNKKELVEQQQQGLRQLIDSVTTKYQEEISTRITQLDELLVEIVMESLYKILGEKENYEKSIAKIVQVLITKHTVNNKISMKVSEESFHLLSKLYKHDPILSCVQLDNSLTLGQIRIDDGISIVAIGLIDQLDYLKGILLGQLREIHGL